MSCSSLYGIDKEFYGECINDYKNSWWFSPIVWGVLTEKYMYHPFALLRFDKEWEILNTKLNNSFISSDRVLWELSNQNIFLSKDKDFVADCIEKFLSDNDVYDLQEDNTPVLKLEHIQERFNEIAEDIRNNTFEYFVFKNTSVDDAVESWFYDYEQEKDCPLNKPNAEFVIIENGNIRDFVYSDEFMRAHK